VSDFDAFAYLESRRFLNSLRQICDDRGRLALWIVFTCAIGFTIFVRIVSPPLRQPFELHNPMATFIGCAALALVGLIAAIGSHGGFLAGRLDGSAEVRFLATSALSARLVGSWLLWRHIFGVLPRSVPSMLIVVISFGWGHPVQSLLSLIMLTMVMAPLPLLAYLLTRRLGRASVLAVCIALAFFAGIVATSVIAAHQPRTMAIVEPFAGYFESIVGGAIIALWTGSGAAQTMLFVLAIAVAILCMSGMTDLYPELYTSALRLTHVRALGKRALSAPHPLFTQRQSQRSTPFSGVWVAIWMELLNLRLPNIRMIFFSSFAIAGGVGIIDGLLTRHESHPGGAFFFSGFFALVAVFQMSAASIANTVVKPLWWIGAGSTFAKLVAWTLAGAMSVSIVLATGVFAATATAQLPLRETLSCVAAAFVLPPLIRAVALATYAFFPRAVDRRGPAGALRTLLTVASLMPLGITGTIAYVASDHSLFATFIATTLIIAVEGSMCILIAAHKIEGNGAAYAL